MNNRLEERVAVVTGAGHGIGRVTARLLAENGAAVVLVDIDEERAISSVRALTDDGLRAESVTADVSTESSWQALVEQTMQTYGRIDILHNNAAAVDRAHLAHDNQITDTSSDVWQHTFAVNLMGTVLGCKYTVPAMSTIGGGSIINMSSSLVESPMMV